jgi:hypothetical protein
MFDLGAVANWIQNNVLYVLFIIAAGSVAVAAINKKVRDGMVTAAVLLLSLFIVVIGHNINGIIAFFQGFFGGAA